MLKENFELRRHTYERAKTKVDIAKLTCGDVRDGVATGFDSISKKR